MPSDEVSVRPNPIAATARATTQTQTVSPAPVSAYMR
jgi:hypothetical protein